MTPEELARLNRFSDSESDGEEGEEELPPPYKSRYDCHSVRNSYHKGRSLRSSYDFKPTPVPTYVKMPPKKPAKLPPLKNPPKLPDLPHLQAPTKPTVEVEPGLFQSVIFLDPIEGETEYDVVSPEEIDENWEVIDAEPDEMACPDK